MNEKKKIVPYQSKIEWGKTTIKQSIISVC